MSILPIQVVYCSWSKFKKEEWGLAKNTIELESTGKKLGELFDLRFRKVETTEPLLCDLEAMVRFKVGSAYRQVQVPCIVEHAGLILEGFEGKSFPGGAYAANVGLPYAGAVCSLLLDALWQGDRAGRHRLL